MKNYRLFNSILPEFTSLFKKNNSLNIQYSKFNLFLIMASLMPILSIGLFNAIVDPYGIINSPVFPHFNQLKPKKFSQDLMLKASEITRIKPKVIFLGSSRVQWGLDPTHPSFSNNKITYNLGLQAPNMYVISRYFEHALTNQPQLEKVILGIDFLMFSQSVKTTAAFRETRLGKGYTDIQDLINILFSIDALNNSKKTLKVNLNSPNNEAIFIDRFVVKDRVFMKGMLVLDEQTKIPGSLHNFTRNMARGFKKHNPYHLSSDSLKYLQKIVNKCREKGIELEIFITPSHALDLEAIRIRGEWSDFEQWKREVSKIAPVWDFSSYNSISTEPISNDMKYFIDSFHFNQEAGNLILDRLLSEQGSKVPPDFGIPIAPENIESHLAKIRTEREVWARKNPDLVKLVQDLKHNQGSNSKKNN